jgi:hypothetical protein
MDRFSGICGHRNAGAGVDTHTDPGRYFDQARLRRFMGTTPPPPPEVDMFWIPMQHGWGMGRLADPTYRAVVAFMQRHLNEQPVVDPKVKNDGQYGDKTATALAQRFGGNGMGVNGNQMATLVLEAKSGGGDGYDHTGLEKKVAEGAVKLTAHKASTDHHNLYVTGVAVEGPTP